MAAPNRRADARPTLLTKEAAARDLSISVDSFERHVMPEVRLVRVGRMVRVPRAELDRWAHERAARALDDLIPKG